MVWPCDFADKLGSHNTVDSVVGNVKMLSNGEINFGLRGQNNKRASGFPVLHYQEVIFYFSCGRKDFIYLTLFPGSGHKALYSTNLSSDSQKMS